MYIIQSIMYINSTLSYIRYILFEYNRIHFLSQDTCSCKFYYLHYLIVMLNLSVPPRVCRQRTFASVRNTCYAVHWTSYSVRRTLYGDFCSCTVYSVRYVCVFRCMPLRVIYIYMCARVCVYCMCDVCMFKSVCIWVNIYVLLVSIYIYRCICNYKIKSKPKPWIYFYLMFLLSLYYI